MSASDLDPSNRVVLLTGAGAGAIAVVRICGPATESFLSHHFSRPVKPGELAYGLLRDGERTLDDVIVAFTDDRQIADLNLHGGPWVVRSVIELCERYGFSRAQAQDFDEPLPDCAVDGANPIEREMLRALPLARTELAVRCLLAQPDAWRQLQELTRDDRERFHSQVQRALINRSGHWLLHPPSVAIIGIPNAGKSTLANALFGQTRSITADLPGTTRDWVADLANMNGLAVLLHDMPGFHTATDSIEQEAIAAAQRRVALADLVLLVLDGERMGSDEQRALSAAFPQALTIINKADRLRNEMEETLLRTKAIDGTGIDAVRRAIAAHFECDELAASTLRWWSTQTKALLEALLRGETWPSEFARLT